MRNGGLNPLDKASNGKKKFKFDFDDLLIVLGAAGVIAGIWLIYHPAAYIIAGAGLLVLGFGNKKK